MLRDAFSVLVPIPVLALEYDRHCNQLWPLPEPQQGRRGEANSISDGVDGKGRLFYSLDVEAYSSSKERYIYIGKRRNEEIWKPKAIVK